MFKKFIYASGLKLALKIDRYYKRYVGPGGKELIVAERDTECRFFTKSTPWKDRWIPICDMSDVYKWGNNYRKTPKESHNLVIEVYVVPDEEDLTTELKTTYKYAGRFQTHKEAEDAYLHHRWNEGWARDFVLTGRAQILSKIGGKQTTYQLKRNTPTMELSQSQGG